MNLDALISSAHSHLGPVRVLRSEDIRLSFKVRNEEKMRFLLMGFCEGKGSRVVYVSSYRADYTRTESLLSILRRSGYDVEECLHPGRPFRVLLEAWRLRGTSTPVMLGFRGHELLPLVRLLLGRRTPLIFDAFVSASDTLCGDRRSVPQILRRPLAAYDRWLAHLADATLVDTEANAHFFRDTLGCQSVHAVYVECNDELFHPSSILPESPTVVLWYGSAQPLHGLDRILHWAKALENENVRFRFIGPVRRRYAPLLKQLRLRNVELVDWVPYHNVPAEISRATLCLGGPFGTSHKAERVIPGKVYQMLACGRPVLVGDTPAMRELLEE